MTISVQEQAEFSEYQNNLIVFKEEPPFLECPDFEPAHVHLRLSRVPDGIDVDDNNYFTEVDWAHLEEQINEHFEITIHKDLVHFVRNIYRQFLIASESEYIERESLVWSHGFEPISCFVSPQIVSRNGWSKEEIRQWKFRFEISCGRLVLLVIPPTTNQNDSFFWEVSNYEYFEVSGRNEMTDIITALRRHGA